MNKILKWSLVGLILLGLMVQVVSGSVTEIETAGKALGGGGWDIFLAIAKTLYPYGAGIGLIYIFLFVKKKKGDDEEEKQDPRVNYAIWILAALIIIALGDKLLTFLQAIPK